MVTSIRGGGLGEEDQGELLLCTLYSVYYLDYPQVVCMNVYWWDQKKKKEACSTNMVSPLIRIIDNRIIIIIDA